MSGDHTAILGLLRAAGPAEWAQATILGDVLLASAHAARPGRLDGRMMLLTADPRVPEPRLRSVDVREVVAADAVAARIDGGIPSVSAGLEFCLPEPGEWVDVEWIEVDRYRVRTRSRRTQVRRRVRVMRHRYRAASGLDVELRDVDVVCLATRLPLGTSGSVVRRAEGGAVVGLVHGSAAANEGATVCLDPRSLNEVVAQLGRPLATPACGGPE